MEQNSANVHLKDLNLDKLVLSNEKGEIFNGQTRKEIIKTIIEALNSFPLVGFDLNDFLNLLEHKNYKFKYKQVEIEKLNDVDSLLSSIDFANTDTIFLYIKTPKGINLNDLQFNKFKTPNNCLITLGNNIEDVNVKISILY